MQLWVQKSSSAGSYTLSMGIDTSPAEQALIERHALESVELWVSPTALTLDAEAEAVLEKTSLLPFGGWRKANKNTAANVRGLWIACNAGREARLTIGDLLAGCALQAEEVYELIAAEQGVRAGFEGLAQKLRAFEEYDAGDEDVVEPKSPDVGTPARDWIKMVR